jgi:single-strand DNA-binding protein
MNTQINTPAVKNLNKVTLIGNIGKEIEMLKTGDKNYCRLSVATTENIYSGGVNKEVTTWHNITLWEKQADFAAENFRKGSRVIVDGKLVSRTYVDKTGKSVYVYEIKCNDIELYHHTELKAV